MILMKEDNKMKLQYDISTNKCWFNLHRWFTEKDTGVNKYQKCLNCSSKRVISDTNKGYQPIDISYFGVEQFCVRTVI